ncbi:PAS domain-containing serine/threonine-protein kinase [Aphelenchoides bicaudatus]|nr:PAS domain-containing serine/threonine-protein kinase [Aphelenchoides bicaudatus]
MNSGCDKRRSSMVPAFGATSHTDQFLPTSENSSFYTSNGQPSQGTTPRGMPPSPGPILLGFSTPGTPQWESQSLQLPAKNRQKAVLTVNAQTTEILIANENLRKLFDLNRSLNSLIGRKLTEVFPSHRNKPKNEFNDLNDSNDLSLEIDEDEDGKTPLHSALFGEDGRLKPVYGKPVDIHNTHGTLNTVCLWSYPLTPIATTSINEPSKERKTSVMLMRSPSAFLPNTVSTPNNSSVLATRQSTTPFSKKPSEKAGETLPSTTVSTSTCNCSQKSVGGSLNVLREEEPGINTPQTQRKPLHAPKGADQTDNGQACPTQDHLQIQTTNAMVVQGELNGSTETDDEDHQLGTIERAFKKNFSTDSSKPLHVQTHDNTGRLNAFMCGSTPIITAGIQSPQPLMNLNNANDTASASSSNGSHMSICQNHCNCKAATRQNAAAYTPLNPHHDAQHVQNHICNDAANCRWLILMNPISALHISLTLGAKGRIFRTDDEFAAVLGYNCTNRLFGTDVHAIIPELNVDIEMNGKPQQCCGSSVKHNGIPFTATVEIELDRDQNPMAFNVQLRSLASINGVVTVTDAGIVYAYNENFLHSLLGRDMGNKEDLITDLIPGFYESSTIASLTADQSNNSSTRVSESENGLSRVDENDESSIASSNGHMRHRTEGRSNSVPTIQVGAFYGLARHKNGIQIPIRFDVTRMDMQSSPRLYAVGIGFERGIDYGISQVDENEHDQPMNGYTRQSSSSEAESDIEMQTLKLTGGDDEFDDGNEGLRMHMHDVTLSALADESNEAICGEYSTYYDTFQLIGNGTFGSVKLAARKDSGLLAVTKFIQKTKVLPESWVRSTTRSRMIPIEVHLLETLNHPNIVKVLDVFENQKYHQIVMEKLGCGMDLFEFVESHPLLDEELTSYIFRQIVHAVQYLNDNGIVHRDIKDENVIIDSNFNCKLIDFGSAAYFGKNIVFTTFCGTLEYCSPEVLTGNKYFGPEVEMWSLGILLYTLVFFSNPFKTPQETVHAEFEIHHPISEGLYQVINWLLNPDPRRRATITETANHWWVAQPADPTKYRFREVVKNSERARVSPPLYVSDLQNHLKNASSCGNLANSSLNSLETAQTQPAEPVGIVSAR